VPAAIAQQLLWWSNVRFVKRAPHWQQAAAQAIAIADSPTTRLPGCVSKLAWRRFVGSCANNANACSCGRTSLVQIELNNTDAANRDSHAVLSKPSDLNNSLNNSLPYHTPRVIFLYSCSHVQPQHSEMFFCDCAC
jgi:hypothetical protein